MSDQYIQNDLPETPASVARGDLQGQFEKALGVNIFEKGLAYSQNGLDENAARRSIIANRTPDQIIDAFAEVRPEWKDAMTEIKGDEQLKGALHNALVKDPTMLDGFAEMVDNGNGKTSPAEIAQQLKDPKARGVLAFTLNKVADEEKYKFDDVKRLIEGSRQQQMAQLSEMGYNPLANMDMQDILGLVQQFLREPQATLNMVADNFASPEQRKALQPLIDGVGTAFGVMLEPIHGETKGYGDHLADAVQWGNDVYRDGRAEKFVKDISGQTDAEIAQQRAEAGVAKPADREASMGSSIEVGNGGKRLSEVQVTAAEGVTPETPAYAPRIAPVAAPAFGNGQ